MENNFTDVMSRKTDNELIKIVTIDIKKYQNAALEAAEKEISSRNLDISEKLEEYKILNEKENLRREKEESELKQKTSALNKSIASTTLRSINFIIDLFAVLAIYVCIIFVIKSATNIVSPREIILINRTTIFCAFLFYFIVTESIFQKTLGKLLTKTKVVDLNGEKPSILNIIIRTFSRLIPFDSLSYLYSLSGFHDKISKTLVIVDKHIDQ
ncbi:RDD family protein [Flavobacterium artemisiae]|uniref:RDD family protein n=1 Tax=Flavobacterium artemisiae TaxID=2126556 RepID=A0ABW4HHY0_9FLAO